MRYYIIAGEASGDLHASNLIKGLLECDPQAQFRFWGGDLMCAAAGDRGQLVRHYRDSAVMGLSDVLRSAGRLRRNIALCKRDLLAWQPDVVIPVDYPGFNMRIARFAHAHGLKVYWYIAPKTWASRERRNETLRRCVDRLYIVFPFEIPYFESKGIPFIYKGNPLVDAVDGSTDTAPVVEGNYIAILAGSRKGEISRTLPICIRAVEVLRSLPQYRDFKFVIAGAPSRSEEDYRSALDAGIDVIFGHTYSLLRYARAAVVNSGTASLEAALLGTPQVVCWSTSALTAFVARKILRVMDHIKYISLGNLIIDELAFSELVQEDFNVENVVSELRSLVEDESRRARMLAAYARIRAALTAPLDGSGASQVSDTPRGSGASQVSDTPRGSGASLAVARSIIHELTA